MAGGPPGPIRTREDTHLRLGVHECASEVLNLARGRACMYFPRLYGKNGKIMCFYALFIHFEYRYINRIRISVPSEKYEAAHAIATTSYDAFKYHDHKLYLYYGYYHVFYF